MFPTLDTMLSDITKWLERPQTFEMWFDFDSGLYSACVWEEIHRRENIDELIQAVWLYMDRHRGRQTDGR